MYKFPRTAESNRTVMTTTMTPGRGITLDHLERRYRPSIEHTNKKSSEKEDLAHAESNVDPQQGHEHASAAFPEALISAAAAAAAAAATTNTIAPASPVGMTDNDEVLLQKMEHMNRNIAIGSSADFFILQRERDEALEEVSERMRQFRQASADYQAALSSLDSLQQKIGKVRRRLDKLEAENDMCYECEVFREAQADASASSQPDATNEDPEVGELLQQMEAMNMQVTPSSMEKPPRLMHRTESITLQLQQERAAAVEDVTRWTQKVADMRLQVALVAADIENKRHSYTRLKKEATQLQMLQKMNAEFCPQCSERKQREEEYAARRSILINASVTVEYPQNNPEHDEDSVSR